jgi:hypothetical protein
MGTRNTSENGRSAWVALCAHSTHNDSDNEKYVELYLCSAINLRHFIIARSVQGTGSMKQQP